VTPADLSKRLTTIGWSQRGVAKRLGLGEQTIRQWLAGKVKIPPDVSLWLDKLARFHERHPPPKRSVKDG
jgi:transcriptional regulator with XRE-family HTH domain